jgi:hypothetical protein
MAMRRSRVFVPATAAASLVLAALLAGCSDTAQKKFTLAPHPAQTIPAGAYSVAWSDLDVTGSGRIVIPGKPDVILTPDQLKDLAHLLFTAKGTLHHGWEVHQAAVPTDATGLLVSPHPHNLVKLGLSFDEKTGLAEEQALTVNCAGCGGLASGMGDFIKQAAGLAAAPTVAVAKFEIANLSYAFHWNPQADAFGPADSAYPAFAACGISFEGTVESDGAAGTFTVAFDRIRGDATGAQVAECPECY